MDANGEGCVHGAKVVLFVCLSFVWLLKNCWLLIFLTWMGWGGGSPFYIDEWFLLTFLWLYNELYECATLCHVPFSLKDAHLRNVHLVR